MGSACCIAARNKAIPNQTGVETLHRNATYSPSWSFRWENRGRVAGEIENPSSDLSSGISRNVLTGVNMVGSGETDVSKCNSSSEEAINYQESPEIAESSAPNLSFSVSSTLSTPTAAHLSSQTHPVLPNSTPSRQARRSPGHQLFRQVSDSRILELKSPNNNSVSEGTPSFVLSTCSNDLAMGSVGASFDGWSMRTFTALVASSQRERWSFDSAQFSSGNGKVSRCSSGFSYSSTGAIDLQTCGACLKPVAERSSWRSLEIPVVAVLVCGHVYHCECLEPMSVGDKYDPACPICMVEENQVSRLSQKASRMEKHSKISRHQVVDSYLDGDFDVYGCRKNIERESEVSNMEPSSSTSTLSAKPFLKRHFSLGSKWNRPLSENDSARKKGFWAKYLRIDSSYR